MKKKMKLILVGAFVLMMAFMFAGCGSGSFEGKLINANSETLVVKGDSDVEVFTTTSQTDYDLAGEDEITAGDSLLIDYHDQGGKKIADKVTIIEAVNHTANMVGELSDLNTTDFVVSSDGLTVKFTYDSDTEVEGNLNEGDEVRVTYKGDLSEEPHALKVEILEEQKDDPHYEAHGIVADISDTSVLLSIDSADSHRFIINADTEVVSSDNKIEVGDRAEITFTGDIDKDPVATKIIVHHQEKDDESVINGTIKNAEKTEFHLNTGKNEYKILVDDKTKFTGAKYQSGAKATVTYKGKLGEEPLAIKVYCDKKKEEDPTKKTTNKTTKKTTAKPTEKPTETKSETKTQTETKTDPPTPTPVIVTVDGDIEVWDGENFKCTIKVDEENSIELTTDKADIPIGYFPQVGDRVRVEYDKDTLEMKDMQLLERPDPDPQTPPDRDEGGKPEPTEPQTTTTKKPTTTTTTKQTTTKAPTTKETTAEEVNSGDAEDNGEE